MSILIRKANESDSEQICEMEEKFFSKNSSLEEIKGQIALEDVYYFVAVIGKKIIGYRNKDGLLKMQCPYCRVVYVSRKMSRRKEVVEVTAPQGQVLTKA